MMTMMMMTMMVMMMCLGVVDDVEGENEGASAAETNHHPLCLLWEIQICIDLTNCLIFLSTMKTHLRKEHEDNSSDHKDDEQCTKHSWARGDRGWGSG